MSGAILQGVPATTLDTDIWIDLPSRQYMRVINLCRRHGAQMRSNTVVDLAKDIAHLPLLEQTMKLQRALARRPSD
jgi:hypothetical protein